MTLFISLFVIRFIAKCGAEVEDLGKPDFISKVCTTVTTAGKLVCHLHWKCPNVFSPPHIKYLVCWWNLEYITISETFRMQSGAGPTLDAPGQRSH
jgi:hypothetical protein